MIEYVQREKWQDLNTKRLTFKCSNILFLLSDIHVDIKAHWQSTENSNNNNNIINLVWLAIPVTTWASVCVAISFSCSRSRSEILSIYERRSAFSTCRLSLWSAAILRSASARSRSAWCTMIRVCSSCFSSDWQRSSCVNSRLCTSTNRQGWQACGFLMWWKKKAKVASNISQKVSLWSWMHPSHKTILKCVFLKSVYCNSTQWYCWGRSVVRFVCLNYDVFHLPADCPEETALAVNLFRWCSASFFSRSTCFRRSCKFFSADITPANKLSMENTQILPSAKKVYKMHVNSIHAKKNSKWASKMSPYLHYLLFSLEADRKLIFRFPPKNKNGRKSSLFFGRKRKQKKNTFFSAENEK